MAAFALAIFLLAHPQPLLLQVSDTVPNSELFIEGESNFYNPTTMRISAKGGEELLKCEVVNRIVQTCELEDGASLTEAMQALFDATAPVFELGSALKEYVSPWAGTPNSPAQSP